VYQYYTHSVVSRKKGVKKMATIITDTETVKIIDTDGNENITTKEKTRKYEQSKEPDYIKLYTRMWCEFNKIPNAYRELFLQLVTRMNYCSTNDLGHSQLVYTGRPYNEDIMSNLNWKSSMYNRGLKELCRCGAIKNICRGVYQISPHYAGKGEWKYNPKLDRGGVEDLIAIFHFKNEMIQTEIVWADGENEDTITKKQLKKMKERTKL